LADEFYLFCESCLKGKYMAYGFQIDTTTTVNPAWELSADQVQLCYRRFDNSTAVVQPGPAADTAVQRKRLVQAKPDIPVTSDELEKWDGWFRSNGEHLHAMRDVMNTVAHDQLVRITSHGAFDCSIDEELASAVGTFLLRGFYSEKGTIEKLTIVVPKAGRRATTETITLGSPRGGYKKVQGETHNEAAQRTRLTRFTVDELRQMATADPSVKNFVDHLVSKVPPTERSFILLAALMPHAAHASTAHASTCRIPCRDRSFSVWGTS
jgi:hypothetical protein